MAEKLYLEHSPHLRVVPVTHHRVAYAKLVYLALRNLDGWKPDAIAVELPKSFESAVIEGLTQGKIGPLWAAKRLEEYLETMPLGEVERFRNTANTELGARGLILEARRKALRELRGRLRCTEADWLSDVHQGFDPVVCLFHSRLRGELDYRRNTVLPGRKHVYSYGYYGPRARISNGNFRSDAAGRVWFAPPALPTATSYDRRESWIGDGNEDYVPGIHDGYWDLDPDLDWKEHFLLGALKFCRDHVILVSGPRNRPDELVDLLADFAGKKIVHININELDPKNVRFLKQNEEEAMEVEKWASEAPMAEIVYLHSGDALMEAVRHGLEHDIPVEFVDGEITCPRQLSLSAHRKQMTAFEDALVLKEGIEAYYQRIRSSAEATRVDEVDEPREALMASRLGSLTKAGKCVFFVCGAAHWGRIRANLTQGPSLPVTEAYIEDKKAELLCTGQYSAGSSVDEIPYVVLEFERFRRKRDIKHFSSEGAFEKLMSNIGKRLDSQVCSISAVLAFERFLHQLCCESHQVLPNLHQLVGAARSCFGEPASIIVLQESMKFWRQCPDGVEHVREPKLSGPGVDVGVRDETLRFASRHGPIDFTYDSVSSKMSEHRESDGNRNRQSKVDPVVSEESWERHTDAMNLQARLASRMFVSEEQPVRSTVSGRLHVRAMIRAISSGRPAVYFRGRTRTSNRSLNLYEAFDPIVWDFGAQNGHQLELWYVDVEALSRSAPLAMVTTVTNVVTVKPGLERYEISGVAFLTPSVALAQGDRVGRWLGRNRHAMAARDDVYRAMEDRDARTSMGEQLLLLALQYCKNAVVHVGDRMPSSRIRRRFSTQSRRLIHVSLRTFEKNDVTRLLNMLAKVR